MFSFSLQRSRADSWWQIELGGISISCADLNPLIDRELIEHNGRNVSKLKILFFFSFKLNRQIWGMRVALEEVRWQEKAAENSEGTHCKSGDWDSKSWDSDYEAVHFFCIG